MMSRPEADMVNLPPLVITSEPFVQVIFGVGTPLAEHSKLILPPLVRLSRMEVPFILGATTQLHDE